MGLEEGVRTGLDLVTFWTVIDILFRFFMKGCRFNHISIINVLRICLMFNKLNVISIRINANFISILYLESCLKIILVISHSILSYLRFTRTIFLIFIKFV